MQVLLCASILTSNFQVCNTCLLVVRVSCLHLLHGIYQQLYRSAPCRERERSAERTLPAPAGPSPLAAALSRLGRPGSGSGSVLGFSTPASAPSAGADALPASNAQAAGAAGMGVLVAPAQTPLAAVLTQLRARTPG